MLIGKGIVKTTTAENIAGSGLSLTSLKRIISRTGQDGLHDVFTAINTEGQPRVTKAKKLLDDIVPKIAEFCEADKDDNPN